MTKTARFTKKSTKPVKAKEEPTIGQGPVVGEILEKSLPPGITVKVKQLETLNEKPRKIAILGTATPSLEDAPYEKKDWQIWNISGNFLHKRRFDMWFEMHTHEVLKANNSLPEYFKFLNDCGGRLMAGHASEAWPAAKIYPIDKIVEIFGDYFTSTASYMVAFAIYLHLEDQKCGGRGIEEIGLYGIDMAIEGEYRSQRPCLEYYLGLAFGLGIKITVAKESPVLRTPAKYAYDYLGLSAEMTSRLKDSTAVVKQCEAANKQTEKDMHYNRGVRDAIKQICEYWNL